MGIQYLAEVYTSSGQNGKQLVNPKRTMKLHWLAAETGRAFLEPKLRQLLVVENHHKFPDFPHAAVARTFLSGARFGSELHEMASANNSLRELDRKQMCPQDMIHEYPHLSWPSSTSSSSSAGISTFCFQSPTSVDQIVSKLKAFSKLSKLELDRMFWKWKPDLDHLDHLDLDLHEVHPRHIHHHQDHQGHQVHQDHHGYPVGSTARRVKLLANSHQLPVLVFR